jgi:anti-sigma regulatory factor (Ser/Thr protein kinase)
MACPAAQPAGFDTPRSPPLAGLAGTACTRAHGNRLAGQYIRHTNSPFMASLRKSFFIKARDFAHAGEASIYIQNLLKSMHLDNALVRRIAVCSYEGEMNAVIHGGDANIHVDIESDHLTLEIADDGPGIEDIARAMQPGYSTASEEAREMGFGAGMGLPNMKNNSDDIRIESAPGQGTRVYMKFLYEAKREFT